MIEAQKVPLYYMARLIYVCEKWDLHQKGSVMPCLFEIQSENLVKKVEAWCYHPTYRESIAPWDSALCKSV